MLHLLKARNTIDVLHFDTAPFPLLGGTGVVYFTYMQRMQKTIAYFYFWFTKREALAVVRVYEK